MSFWCLHTPVFFCISVHLILSLIEICSIWLSIAWVGRSFCSISFAAPYWYCWLAHTDHTLYSYKCIRNVLIAQYSSVSSKGALLCLNSSWHFIFSVVVNFYCLDQIFVFIDSVDLLLLKLTNNKTAYSFDKVYVLRRGIACSFIIARGTCSAAFWENENKQWKHLHWVDL